MHVNVTNAQLYRLRHFETFVGTMKEPWARDMIVTTLIEANRENGGNFDPNAMFPDNPTELRLISPGNVGCLSGI